VTKIFIFAFNRELRDNCR